MTQDTAKYRLDDSSSQMFRFSGTAQELAHWNEELFLCQDDKYWLRSGSPEAHFDVVQGITGSTSHKTLYDSFLWRTIISSVVDLEHVQNSVELLPGSSRTIPIALESLDYGGRLERIDLSDDPRCPKSYHFPITWNRGNLFEWIDRVHKYDLIVGNHILDDLLVSLRYPDRKVRELFYSNPVSSVIAWSQIADAPDLSSHIDYVISLFTRMVGMMRPHSSLILRHYPATLAIKSRDIVRVNLEMRLYEQVTASLADLRVADCQFVDLSAIAVPAACRFPRSVFLCRRRHG